MYYTKNDFKVILCTLLFIFILIPAFSENQVEQALMNLKPGESTEVDIYTVINVEDKFYHLFDGTSANKPGIHVDEAGKTTDLNNTSDMYIMLGKKKAILIDLSNYHPESTAALRDIFLTLAGNRQKIIAVTHSHPDHVGQFSAFADVPGITFLISNEDKPGLAAYAEAFHLDLSRFTGFEPGMQIDLGGRKLDTVPVTGHTPGSVVFLDVRNKTGFSGDAVGSGSGVWLFGSFESYKAGVTNLIKTLDKFHLKDVTLYGGHSSWQQGTVKLNRQYLNDMLTDISTVAQGKFTADYLGFEHRGLNSNIAYGTAIITVGRGKAIKYAMDNGVTYNPYTDISEQTPHYDAIIFCAMTEIFRGTEWTRFEPDKPLTGIQLTSTLAAINGTPIKKENGDEPLDGNQADEIIADFAKTNGLKLPADILFSEKGNPTRAEAAVVIRAIYNSLTK